MQKRKKNAKGRGTGGSKSDYLGSLFFRFERFNNFNQQNNTYIIYNFQFIKKEEKYVVKLYTSSSDIKFRNNIFICGNPMTEIPG